MLGVKHSLRIGINVVQQSLKSVLCYAYSAFSLFSNRSFRFLGILAEYQWVLVVLSTVQVKTGMLLYNRLVLLFS